MDESSGTDELLSADELFFFEKFEKNKGALPLYIALRERLARQCPGLEIEVRKTQISFKNPRLFGAVSFLPVRKAADRPEPFLTATFGLPRRVCSPRIDAAVRIHPGRWTHHATLADVRDVDDELLRWFDEAACFSSAPPRLHPKN